jgi:YebC/PmpR family DNA-binding regulatory protein
MGRGWVHGVREASAAKKGKLFTKIAREIAVAVKMGGASADSNARLRSALKDAQKNSMPKDTVDRAVKRGLGAGEGENYEEVVYEAYGPHGVAMLVESLTDNRNRTVQDLRALFVRGGGNLGEPGSVMWMFDKISSVVASPGKPGADAEEAAINAGANEVEDLGDGQWRFLGGPSDADTIEAELEKLGWKVLSAEQAYKSKTPAELSETQEKDLQDFVQRLDDNDDVKKIHLSL